VISGFCAEAGGPRARVAGHDIGAELAFRAAATGSFIPERLVLMSNRLHRPAQFGGRRSLWRSATLLGAVPGLDLALSHGARLVFRPKLGERLTIQSDPGARDLVRHAFSDVGGNANRARAWAKFARHWSFAAQRDLLDAYQALNMPTLLLWADQDGAAPLQWAEEALDLLPNAQLRTLPDTGFLMAYDDPIGVARELISFCG
jgi:pimeloyl-ACP methyl ester carboxylesterase